MKGGTQACRLSSFDCMQTKVSQSEQLGGVHMTLSDNARGALYMSISMAAFTFGDAAMKIALKTLPLYSAITIRGVMASTGLIILAYFLKGLTLKIEKRDAIVLAVRSASEILSTLFFLAALVHLDLPNLTAIMQALPLAVTLASALVFREPIGWRRLSAIAIGFVGVMIIVRPGLEGFSVWSMLGLGTVLWVVIRDLSTRKLSRDVPSVMVAVCSSVSVTVTFALVTLFVGWTPVAVADTVPLIYAAIALLFGYMFAVMVMRVGDISFIAPFRYTAMLWSMVLGWVIFGVFPDNYTILGAILVIATGMFTMWRERQLRHKPEAVRPR